MAERVVAKPDPTLEVHLPQQIRRRHLKTLAGRGASKGRFDAAGSPQNLVHRRNRRQLSAFAFQTTRNLARSPRRMSVTYRKDARFDLAIGPLRARMRTARAVCKRLIGPPSAKPFIACVRVDAEPPAKLPPVRSFLYRKPDKLPSLIHYRHLAPWHSGLPDSQSMPL